MSNPDMIDSLGSEIAHRLLRALFNIHSAINIESMSSNNRENKFIDGLIEILREAKGNRQ